MSNEHDVQSSICLDFSREITSSVLFMRKQGVNNDMGSFIDITGKKYGRLTAINRIPNTGDDRVRWLFRCDCGKQIITDGASARTGKTRSCGCLNDEMRIQTSTKHGLSSKKIYGVYKAMVSRCHNCKNKKYKIYPVYT